jgi:hypothetical protein
MGIKSFISKPFARFIQRQTRKWSQNPIETQNAVFRDLLQGARSTAFGKDHGFGEIRSYEEFRTLVPVRDYEQHKPYIERVIRGEKDVLWKGAPLYLSKTSGTTSGIKYIPISKESIPFHISAARDALLHYIAETGRAAFVEHKMIFLSGSPELDRSGPVPTGRLSGIVNHYVPAYLRTNQLPSYETNCIEDWEVKVERIVEETLGRDMGLISGIPPWVQMYFDKITAKTGKTISEVFPDFSLFVYGGVNYEPYRKKMEASIGKQIDSIELYPASEGFIAFQDSQHNPGLLLLLNSGIFYEFIPADEFFGSNPSRISLKDVRLNVNYAIILNTNAGLWGYCIGDTVKFVSLNPYRLIVTGRIRHYLSAFGEHVIAEEVEKAIVQVMERENLEIIEYTVAPQVNPQEGLPYHEWFIEFATPPSSLDRICTEIDLRMQQQNIYYRDLIKGAVLQPLKIRMVQKGGFINMMKEMGKLGGQNKVPRLSNDRALAERLSKWTINN